MRALSYDDILLVPQLGQLDSRKHANTTAKLGDWTFALPIMSSPMETVTDVNMASALATFNVLGVMHRFDTSLNRFDSVMKFKEVNPERPAAVAIGGDDINTLPIIADIFVLDVAHSDTTRMLSYVRKFKTVFPSKYLVVGSIATAGAAKRAIEAGADALRVGIGAGAACTTRTVTGFGVPMVSSIIECVDVADTYGIPVIADGGIKNTGDIAKALALGADFVMLGRMFAGTEESPHGTEYFGQASVRSAAHSGGYVEGEAGHVESQGSIIDVLSRIDDALRSAISYGGGTDIKSFQANASWQEVSPLAMTENGTRLL